MTQRNQKGFAPLLVLFLAIAGVLTIGYVVSRIKEKQKIETPQAATPLAFPGAVGFGASTRGAFGCSQNPRVYSVSNVDDFKRVINLNEARLVIIKGSGTWNLGSDQSITNSCLSIYGNKAPGQGVQLVGGGLVFKTNQVVIRYIKVRGADGSGDPIATGGNRPQNLIFDHVSAMWGTDGGSIDIAAGASNVTVSNSILSEGLLSHSKGPSVLYPDATTGGSDNVTLYRNVAASSAARQPMVKAKGRIDVINNVIYNWDTRAGEGVSQKMNIIGNTWKKGPQTSSNCAWYGNLGGGQPSGDNGPVYFNDNSISGMSLSCGSTRTTNSPYTPYSVPTIKTASQAYDELIVGARDVGANLPGGSDATDTRILNNVKDGTGSIKSNPDLKTLSGGTSYTDNDNDGMADSWESQYSLTDAMADPDGDGYRNIEEFLNDTNPKGGSVVTNPPTVTSPPTATPPTGGSPTFTPTPTTTSDGNNTTLKFTPTKDATVNKNEPNRNYGSSTKIVTDGSPVKQFWITFKTGKISGSIVEAKLVLYNTDSSPSGGNIYYTSKDTWSETGLTWNNQPSITGSLLSSVRQVTNGNKYEWDVTSAINNTEEHYTFVMKSTNSDGADYNSKNNSSNKPELLIKVQ